MMVRWLNTLLVEGEGGFFFGNGGEYKFGLNLDYIIYNIRYLCFSMKTIKK